MKKNFFKKLALVMALALTVTSVPATNASAAVKAPGFKSKAVKVNVDQTKKYSTANTTKYSVSFKIGNKKVATIATSKKAVKVTGVAAGKTTLKATFKNYKTKKVTTAKVPVTVVEVAATVKSVEAKGVKTLVVTFNKAVDTTKAVVAVTKGTAKPSITSTTWADDKKSATIAMGSKLTEGTYTVSVTGLTAAAITGTVTVKDETLTSIEIVGTNLVRNATDAAIATIPFKTVNQYGERMSITNPTVTSSFGTASIEKSCSATATGIIKVSGIAQTLQIYGTSGSVTVVDTTKGVTVTATVTYSAAATAKTMTLAGLYNVSDAKLTDMTKGDNVNEYVILAQIADQYGNNLVAAKLNTDNRVTANLVPGGNVTAPNGVVTTWYDKTVDGKDYVALPLTGTTAIAGTFYYTFVNPSLGLLANTSFVVKSGTVIKTLSISANDSIYQGQDNTLAFEAVDTDGNAVTKYSVLNDLVKFTIGGASTLKFVKQADGSAKLVYNPENTLDVTYGSGKKNSTVSAFTATANEITSTSYLVKSLTFTTYQKRIPHAVTGLKSGTATAVASGESFKLYASDLVVEDQYSNVMSDTEVKAIPNLKVATSVNDATPVGDITVSAGTFPTAPGTHSVTVQAGLVSANATTLRLGVGTTSDYDVTLITVDSMKATNLTIKSINSGDVVKSVSASAINVANVEVTGSVAGKTVVIPKNQYIITGNTGYELVAASSVNPAQSLAGKLEVTVDTNNGSVVLSKEYTFSNATATVTKIETTEGATLATGNLNVSNFAGLFTIKSQYGQTKLQDATLNTGDVKYDVVDVTGKVVNGKVVTRTISHNNTNSVTVSGAETGDVFTVTATYGTITVTKTITV